MSTSKSAENPSKGMDSPTKKMSRQEYNRTHSLRLPTPPPDPTQPDIFEQANVLNKETIDKETEFLEYLDSLPMPSRDKPTLQRTTSVFAPAMAAEDAFDHLEKLYKVMEQLLNLRYQNSKLQRRIQDLEHARTLQEMHRESASAVLRGEDTELPELNEDYMLAEAFLDNIFSRNKRYSRTKPQFKITRNFSVVSEESVKPEVDDVAQKSIPLDPSKKTSKVSKWTRVKAAFKWEKASPTVSGAKSQDSGIGGMLPVNSEVARYLRVPSSSDNPTEGVSPADSVLSGSWQGTHGLSTPGTISPASSTDDLNPTFSTEHRSVSRTGSAGTNVQTRKYGISTFSDEDEGDRRSRSLDYTSNLPLDIGHPTKDDLHKLHISKHHKTPWGKVKDIIQTRKDSLRKKQYRLSARSDDTRSADWSAGSDQDDAVFIEGVLEQISSGHHNLTNQLPNSTGSNSLTITHPLQGNSAMRSQSSGHIGINGSQTSPTVSSTRNQSVCSMPKEFPGAQSMQSVSFARNHSADGAPVVTVTNTEDTEDCDTRRDAILVRRNSEDDRSQSKSSGSPKTDRVSKWSKVKKAFLTSSSKSNPDENQSVPSSPTNKQSNFFVDIPTSNTEDPVFTKPPRRKISEDDLKSKKFQEEIYRSYEQLQKKLSLEFQEKLQEWERVKAASSSNTVSTTIPQCSSNLPSPSEEQKDTDFAKKMEEWEKMKNNDTLKKKNIPMTSGENLPPEFKKKLQEWEKIKKGTKEPPESVPKKKISDWSPWKNTQKQELPQLGQPDNRQFSDDFLKKLDEWKQIKANRDLERSNSDQERRKSVKDNKSPSPCLGRKDSSGKLLRQSKKYKTQDEKELQWLEKELQKIDREKLRLEREREKFLEREERLAKLRRSVGTTSAHKKDVLVQTSTGFYRFEGISRKFTQKLYEWEKAKGIRPEASTMALLNTGYNQVVSPTEKASNSEISKDPIPRIKLHRSKSMDSVHVPFPTMTQQPSSLSLNDMEELEVQCLARSRTPSPEDMTEDIGDEPEAVLVEVEDLVEETASPLEERVEGLKAVWSTETANLCESEKCEAPQVRRSESARALSSYNHIQEIIMLLNKLIAAEKNFRKKADSKIDSPTESKNNTDRPDKSTGAIPKRMNKNVESKQIVKESPKKYYEKQKDMGKRLFDTCVLLQGTNSLIVKNILSDDCGYTATNLYDNIDTMQDLSAELVTIVEKLKLSLTNRLLAYNKEEETKVEQFTQDILDYADSLTSKIMELKRSLTYICAASDMTAPGRKKKPSIKDRRQAYHRSLSSEAAVDKNENNTSDEEQLDKEKVKIKRKNKLVKSKSEDSHPSTGKIFGFNKKDKLERTNKIHFDEEIENKENINEAQKEIIVELHKKREQRKLLRTRRISDGHVSYNKELKSEEQPETIVEVPINIVVPTNVQYLDGTLNEVPASPVSVFVQTTRKLFTPFVSESLDFKKDTSQEKYTKQSSTTEDSESTKASESPKSQRKLSKGENSEEKESSVSIENTENNQPIHLPPLPNSPVFQRRERTITKETSPAIRIMIARYNQKLSEQDNPGYKSGGSSGSASPVAWRSPVLERRVKTQSEKYQEEVNKSLITNPSKYSPLFAKKQVQKSASVGVMSVTKKQFTIPQNPVKESNEKCDPKASPKMIRGILKSSSVDSLKRRPPVSHISPLVQNDVPFNKKEARPPVLPKFEEEKTTSFQDRAYKLQRAKEQFFQITTNPTPSTSKEPEEPKIVRNRLSQVSFGSESSCDDMTCSGMLVKSASAGMINIDEEVYQQFKPEMHIKGYVSLPRSTKKKEDKFGISSITSKFRKVKMRKSKEMNAVSTLCRQSLVVDINLSANNENNIERKKDEKTSWLKNPSRIFKPK